MLVADCQGGDLVRVSGGSGEDAAFTTSLPHDANRNASGSLSRSYVTPPRPALRSPRTSEAGLIACAFASKVEARLDACPGGRSSNECQVSALFICRTGMAGIWYFSPLSH